MKHALFFRLFVKGLFQHLGVANSVVLGADQNPWRGCAPSGDLAPAQQRSSDHGKSADLSERPSAKATASRGRLALSAAAIAAAVLVTSASPFQIASASTPPPEDIKPITVSQPVALYLTLCLWSQHRPAVTCRELRLTPGPAGPMFASMKACQDGQEEAVGKWREQAGPVFGFTAMAGDGYRIDGTRCALVAEGSRYRDE
jgi:hypothetical protein